MKITDVEAKLLQLCKMIFLDDNFTQQIIQKLPFFYFKSAHPTELGHNFLENYFFLACVSASIDITINEKTKQFFFLSSFPLFSFLPYARIHERERVSEWKMENRERDVQ